MESLTRFKRHPSLNTQRQQLAAPQVMPMPGLPAPGSGAGLTAPHFNYPAPGPTVLGFCYANDLLLDAAIQSLDTSSSAAVIAAQATADTALANAATAQTTADGATTTANAALPKAGGTMTGDLRVNGKIGVNAAPAMALDVVDPTTNASVISYSAQATEAVRGYLTCKTTPGSGLRGLHIQRKSTDALPIGMTLETDLGALWDTTAIDATTTDLVLAYAHQTGDPGDHLRLSQDTLLNGGVKFFLGGESIGTPAANSCVLTVVSPTGATTPVGGLAVRCFNNSNHLELTQRSASSDQSLIAMAQKVVMGFDYSHTQDDIWRLLDINAAHSVPAAGNKNRLAVTFPNTIQGAVGLNTASPGGLLDIRGEVATGATVIFNRYLIGSRTDGGAPNRSFVLGQLTSTAGTDNMLLLSGDMDPAATIAAPTLNSTTSHGSGWWFDAPNNVSHLIASPAGSNQTPSKSFSWGQSAGSPTASFFGGALAVKPTVSGSRGGNAALASLLTALSGLGLLTDSSSA